LTTVGKKGGRILKTLVLNRIQGGGKQESKRYPWRVSIKKPGLQNKKKSHNKKGQTGCTKKKKKNNDKGLRLWGGGGQKQARNPPPIQYKEGGGWGRKGPRVVNHLRRERKRGL